MSVAGCYGNTGITKPTVLTAITVLAAISVKDQHESQS